MFGKFKNQFVGVSPSGKAPDSDSGIPRFESSYPSQIKKSFSSERTVALNRGSYGKAQQTIGVSPSGKAPDSDSGIPRFESSYPSHFNAKKLTSVGFFAIGVLTCLLRTDCRAGALRYAPARVAGFTSLRHTSAPDASAPRRDAACTDDSEIGRAHV